MVLSGEGAGTEQKKPVLSGEGAGTEHEKKVLKRGIKWRIKEDSEADLTA